MRRLIPVLLVIVTSTLALVDAQDLGRRLGGANGPTPTEATPNKPAPKLADELARRCASIVLHSGQPQSQ